MFEKIYFIHNPLNDATDWVSEMEIKIGSQKLKNVFGVQYLDDVKIMLQYNSQFQEAVMKEYNLIGEDNLSLNHVCRLISKEELIDLLNKEGHEIKEKSPFNPIWIELKDGCFFWNKEKKCFEQAVESKNAH